MGASLVWHIRQMSPAATSCAMTTSWLWLSTTCTLPAQGSSKVLSWEPYSSAFFAISPTLDTEPIVDTSNWPFLRQSCRHASYIVA